MGDKENMATRGTKESLHSAGNHEMLKELLRHAIRAPHIEDFKKVLTKALPA